MLLASQTTLAPAVGTNVIARRRVHSPFRQSGPPGPPRVQIGEHRPQDQLHLELGEGGPDAPPDASSERDPGKRVRGLPEEALGAERLRVLVNARVAVRQVHARGDPGARGEQHVANLQILLEPLTTIGTTGLTRRVSLTVASRYSSPPSSISPTSRSSVCG